MYIGYIHIYILFGLTTLVGEKSKTIYLNMSWIGNYPQHVKINLWNHQIRHTYISIYISTIYIAVEHMRTSQCIRNSTFKRLTNVLKYTQPEKKTSKRKPFCKFATYTGLNGLFCRQRRSIALTTSAVFWNQKFHGVFRYFWFCLLHRFLLFQPFNNRVNLLIA